LVAVIAAKRYIAAKQRNEGSSNYKLTVQSKIRFALTADGRSHLELTIHFTVHSLYVFDHFT